MPEKDYFFSAENIKDIFYEFDKETSRYIKKLPNNINNLKFGEGREKLRNDISKKIWGDE